MVKMVRICLLVVRTFLLTAVVVTAIPMSAFISLVGTPQPINAASSPETLTLGSSVNLPLLGGFTDVEAAVSGRLRFISGGTSIEVLNLGFTPSSARSYGDGDLELNSATTNLESVAELVERVFPGDSGFTPTIAVTLTAVDAMGSNSEGPHTLQTVFVSDGTLSFVLFLQADGMIGTITSDLVLELEFLSSGEIAGTGSSQFSHPNSGINLDGVETQSNGCIAGLYGLRLDSTAFAPDDFIEPVTRLIPRRRREVGEGIGDFIICVRSCGNPAAGILDNNILANFATVDDTATATQDYQQQLAGMVEFDIGDTEVCATFNIMEDTTDEPNEVFFIDWTLDFSSASDRTYELQRQRTRVVIRDNDPPPTSPPPTPTPTTPRPRPRYCWICTRSQWLTRRRLCLFSIRIICGYTFPIANVR